MFEPVQTQLYLTAPSLADFDAGLLERVLREGVASLLVDISAFAEGQAEALESMISLADAAECPLLVGGDDALALGLAGRFALDGVHLIGGAKQIAWARKQIGQDAIVGYEAGISRDDAMTAAECGADYVMLGPLAELDPDLASWWQAVIETPLVVDAGADPSLVAGTADFVMIRDVFAAPDPLLRLQEIRNALAA